MKCIICDNIFIQGHWTDANGIATCASCGSPYRILHRSGDGELLDKEPECIVRENWVDKLRKYHKDNPNNLIPSGCNIPGSSYEMCSPDDFDRFNNYFLE